MWRGACGRGVRRQRLAAEESGGGERKWRKGCVCAAEGYGGPVRQGRVSGACGKGERRRRAGRACLGAGRRGVWQWRAAVAFQTRNRLPVLLTIFNKLA